MKKIVVLFMGLSLVFVSGCFNNNQEDEVILNQDIDVNEDTIDTDENTEDKEIQEFFEFIEKTIEEETKKSEQGDVADEPA